ncbi:aldehyde dehydrogenase family protein [Bradyrhizobium cenepequi]|uniref:aldehyde dehydrogenase family protein n=1 Tax=Bradyrhizobium cenepequi TaxID=2821403 RepID=UPI001CE31C70|nr:aldehyde dehydrogenase family protein [Bradyrhizobium cenepequi]MCA6109764.1 aldehyde dehydrogenase family protein [Bradyrhizobium cenepequi]
MLKSDRLTRYDHLYIGGSWVAPEDGGFLESIDPSTGRPWARVAFGGPGDIDRAVAAAREALNGPWGRMPGHERAALLRKFADLYAQRAADLAVLETRDSGRALRESRADIGGHTYGYHWWASLADKHSGRTIPFDDSVHCGGR